MDLIELLRRSSNPTEAVLAKVGASQADRKTPCPEMTVTEVASHLIGGLRSFAVVGEGGPLSFDPGLDPEPGAEPPARTFRAAVDHLLAVFGVPGRLDATFTMPWGPTTGSQLIGFELIETVVHGWDVARGLGVDLAVDDDVAKATLDGARMWVDDSVRVPGMFGPEVPTDSVRPLDRLVAFLGRDPAWNAAGLDG